MMNASWFALSTILVVALLTVGVVVLSTIVMKANTPPKAVLHMYTSVNQLHGVD